MNILKKIKLTKQINFAYFVKTNNFIKSLLSEINILKKLFLVEFI